METLEILTAAIKEKKESVLRLNDFPLNSFVGKIGLGQTHRGVKRAQEERLGPVAAALSSLVAGMARTHFQTRDAQLKPTFAAWLHRPEA